MRPISRAERVFFLCVAGLALWVGAFGAFAPRNVDWALPWLVPPLHARFLGAMYLSGAVFMLGAAASRAWSGVRVVDVMCAVWTGLLLLVSLFHLPEFDFRKQQVWIWFGAYTLFPLGAAAIAGRRRRERESAPGPPVPAALRGALRAAGAPLLVLAGALFVAPSFLATVWPWAITPLLAQLYSAPFLSFGLGAFLAASERSLADARLYLVATLVFAAGVLVASAVHRSLFSAAHVSDWLWFAGFALATVALAAGAWRALWRREALAPRDTAVQNAARS